MFQIQIGPLGWALVWKTAWLRWLESNWWGWNYDSMVGKSCKFWTVRAEVSKNTWEPDHHREERTLVECCSSRNLNTACGSSSPQSSSITGRIMNLTSWPDRSHKWRLVHQFKTQDGKRQTLIICRWSVRTGQTWALRVDKIITAVNCSFRP